VKAGYLKEFVVDPRNQESGIRAECSAPRESSPAIFGSNHSHCPKGLLGIQEEGGDSYGISGRRHR